VTGGTRGKEVERSRVREGRLEGEREGRWTRGKKVERSRWREGGLEGEREGGRTRRREGGRTRLGGRENQGRWRDYKWQPISDYSGSPFCTTTPFVLSSKRHYHIGSQSII